MQIWVNGQEVFVGFVSKTFDDGRSMVEQKRRSSHDKYQVGELFTLLIASEQDRPRLVHTSICSHTNLCPCQMFTILWLTTNTCGFTYRRVSPGINEIRSWLV